MAEVWIFGYGSLMWDNDEYSPSQVVSATLSGAHRSYNRKSTSSRGTRARPGIVLGLESGGKCIGKAMLVDQRHIAAIDRRESAGKGYLKITTPSQGLKVKAGRNLLKGCLVYVSNPRSPNYIGERMSVKQRAQMAINAAPGDRGTSVDYIKKTHRDCHADGISDLNLKKMYDAVRALLGEESSAHTHTLSHTITDVEVYDSPGSYGAQRIRSTDPIIGLSKEIRDALHITGKWDDHCKVTVKHGLRKVTAKAVQTDKRLTSNGTCPADDQANHCWMTPRLRQALRVKELPRSEWSHRLNYPALKKKYSSVKILPAE